MPLRQHDGSGPGAMLIRRRIWLYRLAGQLVPQQIVFDRPVTAATVRKLLRRTVGNPMELWGRGLADPAVGRG